MNFARKLMAAATATVIAGHFVLTAGNPGHPLLSVGGKTHSVLDRDCGAGRDCGVERIALEMHGNQCVYIVPSLKRLRDAVGPIGGANLDPSHLFWMWADPLVAAEAPGGELHHVHAKDTMLNAPVQATTSLLENGSLMDIPARSWS